MPIRLDTVLRKVEQMSNEVNSDLLKDFYQHMKDSGTSQNYQKGNLKAMIHFAEHIGPATSFYDVDHEQVVEFLDTKIRAEQIDSDKKWITTWNDYLWRLKLFFRWLHNKKVKEIKGEEVKPEDEWKTSYGPIPEYVLADFYAWLEAHSGFTHTPTSMPSSYSSLSNSTTAK